jgi:hypothetical protein
MVTRISLSYSLSPRTWGTALIHLSEMRLSHACPHQSINSYSSALFAITPRLLHMTKIGCSPFDPDSITHGAATIQLIRQRSSAQDFGGGVTDGNSILPDPRQVTSGTPISLCPSWTQEKSNRTAYSHVNLVSNNKMLQWLSCTSHLILLLSRLFIVDMWFDPLLGQL